MKIALIVMESRCAEPEKNCSKICGYIREAGRAGAEMAVFPEASLTGYCPKHVYRNALQLDNVLVENLRLSAEESGVTSLVGMAEQKGDELFMTQIVCGSKGTLSVYRKTHLGPSEKTVFSAGDSLDVFGGTIPFGIAICYDMHFPEVAASFKAQGAGLIVSPHASPVKAGQRSDIWMKYMPARAYDNRVYAACCNLCGSNGCGTQFSGGATVYSPDGSVAMADFSGNEGMLVLDLSSTSFDGAADYPAHRRPELYF